MAHLRSQVFPAQVLHSGTLAPALEASSAGVSVVRNRPGNRLGTRWRGKIPIPPHAHPLVRKLVELANREQTTMREIALRAGLRPETVCNWRYRNSPRIADLEAAFNALGYEIQVREVGS